MNKLYEFVVVGYNEAECVASRQKESLRYDTVEVVENGTDPETGKGIYVVACEVINP